MGYLIAGLLVTQTATLAVVVRNARRQSRAWADAASSWAEAAAAWERAEAAANRLEARTTAPGH